ncbi:MAG TPA: hypothetical protein VGH13_23035 [Xanthobacteraceae bacterium]|jgi:hypothetical protein
MNLSPAGNALGLDSPLGTVSETPEERKKRLAALQATQARIASGLGSGTSLSPAGAALFGGSQ